MLLRCSFDCHSHLKLAEQLVIMNGRERKKRSHESIMRIDH